MNGFHIALVGVSGRGDAHMLAVTETTNVLRKKVEHCFRAKKQSDMDSPEARFQLALELGLVSAGLRRRNRGGNRDGVAALDTNSIDGSHYIDVCLATSDARVGVRSGRVSGRI
jgi:hypothetical protein